MRHIGSDSVLLEVSLSAEDADRLTAALKNGATLKIYFSAEASAGAPVITSPSVVISVPESVEPAAPVVAARAAPEPEATTTPPSPSEDFELWLIPGAVHLTRGAPPPRQTGKA